METFQQPAHAWQAKRFGLVVTGTTHLNPGDDIAIDCKTLCGDETAKGEYTITNRMSVAEAVRRAQFAASIQHVMRRACTKCRDLYQHGTNRFERQYLITTHPELGPIIGVDLRGKYGVPLGPVIPEQVGTTDQSALDRFRQDHVESQAMMKEKLKEIRDKAGKA